MTFGLIGPVLNPLCGRAPHILACQPSLAGFSRGSYDDSRSKARDIHGHPRDRGRVQPVRPYVELRMRGDWMRYLGKLLLSMGAFLVAFLLVSFAVIRVTEGLDLE